MRVLGLAAGLLLSAMVQAHPLAPALLELREVAQRPAAMGGLQSNYEVLWRTSIARAQRADVAPVLPADCADTQPRRLLPEEGALTLRWTVRCAGGLAGRELAVSGLADSGINVIVSVAAAGRAPVTALLDAREPAYTVPAAGAQAPVFGAYLALGVEHLLSGFDHLLFVAGLVLLLVARMRMLVLTVTAFTIGHSVTLSLATLGVADVNSGLMELGIALSILMLAVELARADPARPSLLARQPALMAGLFGLVHGLGFAGALAEVGLPQDRVPLALFAFNLGIEIGQLAVIAGLALLAAAARRLPRLSPAPARGAAVYLIGSLAAFWCYERAAGLI